MRIDVSQNRIEGWCNIPGWHGEQCVIVFSTIRGRWHVASSMCFPSDIKAAMIVHECVINAFNEFKKMIETEVENDT